MITQPDVMVRPFGNAALGPTDPGGAVLPIPVPSQIAVLPGAASFTDGFPPLTMLDPASQGGVPPYGQDMQGLLYMVTWYLAWLQGGGGFYWDAAFVAENTGYAEGAILRSATNDSLQWLSTVDDNATDPDSGGAANWIALTAGGEYLSVAVSAGTTHDLEPVGFTAAVSYLDLDTTAGSATVDGIANGFNGRKLIITNTGANLLTLAALTGSSASNQFRLPSDFSIVQNQSVALEYVGGIAKWIAP